MWNELKTNKDKNQRINNGCIEGTVVPSIHFI
jgi:hypothetical protein